MRNIKEASTNNENRKAIMGVCPVSFALDKVGGRWKPLILWNLRDGRLRYSELRKAIPPISEKMLIQHLKQLEADNLVQRVVVEVMPPHVEYSLSESGAELLPALTVLADWGLRNSGQSQ
ncbi:MAG: transcriptional regulator [Flavobacterium sp. BFFFF1]|uniref:winged helix-turn-helix transcriptional regulator n=1 Tax=Flavobacterium sp. BFFFF1 TaxID=2015557 RepID=UPI000BC56758|nr:helix-turn-helix domain-containing protein [Flavobacterium sp. BFFFF1]OYU81117.1 MAG: transcriptional regulator [Flavobacterium sp. BFFFF1]